MENKQNGRGIFYGVIGVATLVVAIIGATFAFFTAVTNTDNEAINVSAAKVNLALNTAKTISHFKNNMIPVDVLSDASGQTGNANEDFYKYPGNEEGKGFKTCVDDVNNSICSLYQITVQNPAGSPTQTVEGYIQVTLNEKFKNLHYAVFSGTIDQLENATAILQDDQFKWQSYQATEAGSGKLITWGIIDSTITGESSTSTPATYGSRNEDTGVMQITEGARLKTNGGWTPWGINSAVRLEATHEATYTILLWLEDTNTNQNAEMEAVMTAAVKFETSSGSTVTGVISATGPTGTTVSS